MDANLNSLLERARNTQTTASDRETQRISFAYGNSKFENDCITRDTVVRESERLRNDDTAKPSK